MHIREFIASRPRLAFAVLALLGVVLAAAVALGLGRLLSHDSGAAPRHATTAARVTPAPSITATPSPRRAHSRPVVRRKRPRHAPAVRPRAPQRRPRPVPRPALQPPPVHVPAPLPTPTPEPDGQLAGVVPDDNVHGDHSAGAGTRKISPVLTRPAPSPTPAPTATPTPLPLRGDS